MKLILCPALVVLAAASGMAADPAEVTIREDFEKGAERWTPTAAGNWRVAEDNGGKVYELFDKSPTYKPPHRSPHNFALMKGSRFADVTVTARVKTTAKSYGHRDVVLVFGYRDPAHFYYVHFGEKADDHSGQIFIVNDAPRTKISTKETKGTPWKDDTWHTIRMSRRAADGTIRVWFDDMEKTLLEATDTTFGAGEIGFGSFDDTARFDDVVISGTPVAAEK